MRSAPPVGLLGVSLIFGCTTGADDAPSGDTEAESQQASPQVLLARKIWFESAKEGVGEGFDLDGLVTGPGDGSGCGIEDFTAADGTAGIDNSFAGLMDVVVAVGGQAVPQLLQDAVTNGELLLLFSVGTPSADCIPIDILRGADVPALGTDGAVLPGQTFDVDPSLPKGAVACATTDDRGQIVGGDLTMRLPLNVFDETLDLSMTDGRIAVSKNPDGTWSGKFAGGVSVAEIAANVHGFDAIPSSLVSAVDAALAVRGDLDGPEGPCSRISVTFGFEGVPVFLFDPIEEADSDTPVAD